MVRLWRRIERADEPYAYARAVLVNTAASRWRRGRKRHDELTAGRPAGREPAPDPATGVVLRDAVRRALAELPPRTRAVLVLRYFEDLTEAQTAAALGCSVGTVKSQASRGLARLREPLDRDDLTFPPHPGAPRSAPPRRPTAGSGGPDEQRHRDAAARHPARRGGRRRPWGAGAGGDPWARVDRAHRRGRLRRRAGLAGVLAAAAAVTGAFVAQPQDRAPAPAGPPPRSDWRELDDGRTRGSAPDAATREKVAEVLGTSCCETDGYRFTG